MSAQPVLLQQLPSTEFIVSLRNAVFICPVHLCGNTPLP